MTTETFKYVDLDMGTGRSLRVGAVLHEDGTPQRLILVPVWSDGGGADHRHRIDVTAAIVPQLVEALQTLTTEENES